MTDNRICRIFGIKYPIIEGGMAWVGGWRLAAAVSNAGGLGLLGAGSMDAELLRSQIAKLKAATSKPWGINIPLMSPLADTLADIAIEEGAKAVFTSAGSPARLTPKLHEAGIKVGHVVANSKFARKCEAAGVDAVVAEGFEAGGHNGRDELTTMVLLPQVRRATTLPLIAAGGIASGEAIAAAIALGAEGVQIGTLFALSEESAAAEAFKTLCTTLGDDATMLALKKIAPTRLVRNALYEKIAEAEARGADADELRQILGPRAAKRGMAEGDIEGGELEIGQAVAEIGEIRPAAEIMQRLVSEYRDCMKRLVEAKTAFD